MLCMYKMQSTFVAVIEHWPSCNMFAKSMAQHD